MGADTSGIVWGDIPRNSPFVAPPGVASGKPTPITQETIDTLKSLRDPWFRAKGANPDEPMGEIVARLWTPMLNGDYFVLKATDLNDADGKHLAARMTLDIDGAALLASQSPDV